MNEIEVQRQVDQMVRFIKQEAEEKANEIMVSADEEFNLEKLQLLDAEKQKIRKEYERKEAQVEVKKKIEYSKQLNEMRLKVLRARDEAVTDIVYEAKAKLLEITKNASQYKPLLTDLLVQSMYKLNEPAQLVRCRQVDQKMVEQVLEQARNKYAQMFGDAPTLTVDKKNFLPPAPTDLTDTETPSCCGGVVVSTPDLKICVANTLEHRLDITFTQNLPSVRALLFGTHARA